MSGTATRVEHRPAQRSALVPLIVTVVAGGICYGLFVRRGVWLSVVGYSVSPSERVLNGEVPYRDFLYNYTPGVLWLNALLMKLFGSSLLTVNAGIMGFKLATLVALYAAGRRLTGQLLALVPVVLTLAWLGYRYIYGVVPTQYSLLFVLLAMICMLRFDESNRVRWLLMCGCAIGLVFVFKYNVGILLSGASVAVLAIRGFTTRSGRQAGSSSDIAGALEPVSLRSHVLYMVILGAGIVLIAGSMAVYLYSQDALGPMVNHFRHHALDYADRRAVPLPSPKWLLPVSAGVGLVFFAGMLVLHRAEKWFAVYAGTVVAVALVVLFFPGRAYIIKHSASATVAYLAPGLIGGALAALAWNLFRARGSGDLALFWRRHSRTIIVALFALGAYLEVYPRADYYHLVRALPLIFLFMTVLAFEYGFDSMSRVRLPGQHKRNTAIIGLSVLILIIAVGVKDTWIPQFDSRFSFRDRTALETSRAAGMLVTPRQKRFIEELDALIQNHSAPGDYIFSFAQRGAGFYFLSERRNPTRFVWWRSVGISEDNRNEVLRAIDDGLPKLIVLQDSLRDPRVREQVSARYEWVGSANDLAVFSRRQRSAVKRNPPPILALDQPGDNQK